MYVLATLCYKNETGVLLACLFLYHVFKNLIYFYAGHFQGVCVLFCEFMANVKVTDYSTTEITSSAVHDLVVTMETEILAPLLQRFIDNKEVWPVTCKLLHCKCIGWGS